MTRSYRWIAGALLVVVLVLVLRWAWVLPTIAAERCRLTQNAAWIRVDWTSTPVDTNAVAGLADRAAHRRLRYLFPFTTYVTADGTFSPSYENAGAFTSTFRDFNQETVLLAWIGIPLQNDSRVGIQGTVDLSDETSRQQIVAFIAQLMQDTAFDGVHLDVETVLNEDEQFLLLLEEVHASLDDDDLLSIAGSYWMPSVTAHVPVIGGVKWDHEYYRAVASRVDQIAVMTYDSFLPHPACTVSGCANRYERLAAPLRTLTSRCCSDSLCRGNAPSRIIQTQKTCIAGLPASVRPWQAPMQQCQALWEADVDDWHLWENVVSGTGSQ